MPTLAAGRPTLQYIKMFVWTFPRWRGHHVSLQLNWCNMGCEIPLPQSIYGVSFVTFIWDRVLSQCLLASEPNWSGGDPQNHRDNLFLFIIFAGGFISWYLQPHSPHPSTKHNLSNNCCYRAYTASGLPCCVCILRGEKYESNKAKHWPCITWHLEHPTASNVLSSCILFVIHYSWTHVSYRHCRKELWVGRKTLPRQTQCNIQAFSDKKIETHQ